MKTKGALISVKMHYRMVDIETFEEKIFGTRDWVEKKDTSWKTHNL